MPGSQQARGVQKSEGLCARHGVCLCSFQGKRLWSIRNGFLKALKLAFPRAELQTRRQLQDGCVCCEISWEPHVQAEGAWSQALTQLLSDSDDEMDIARPPMWFHIGLLYLKPFRPTMQSLSTEAGWKAGSIQVRQTGKFQTLLSALSLLPQTQALQVRFYRLLDTAAPVSALRPATAWAQPLSESEKLIGHAKTQTHLKLQNSMPQFNANCCPDTFSEILV